MNMDLKSILKDVELPPVVVKIDDDSIRNLGVSLLFVGAALMVAWVVLSNLTSEK